jgi:hypothetical protein
MRGESIPEQFHISPEEAKKLSAEAIRVAVDCGKSGANKQELSDEDWNRLQDLAENVWNSNRSIGEKVRLTFALYGLFPHYFIFLRPLYSAFERGEIPSVEIKDSIWKKFMGYLGDENYYSDPVGYVLWADFFEDPETVREAWLRAYCEL